MINLLIRWSLDNRVTVLGLAVLLTVIGSLATARMPVDVFPDLTAPTVTVLVEGHGMSPLEMETQVTFPIEAAMNGASDVRRVRSGTSVGISVVWIEFEWGTDIYRARQTVAERLAGVTGSLPPQVKSPTLAPISSIMGEILFASLTSDRHDGMDLRSMASTTVRRRLLAVPGVSQVTPIGGDTKQYQVVLSERRLQAYDLTSLDVLTALEETNENVAGGILSSGTQELIVEGIGRVVSVADIGATVVTVRGGVPILVSDLGLVRVGAALKRGMAAASRRGDDWEPIIEPGVVIAIQKQPGANTLELTARLDVALEEIAAGLPDGMYVNRDIFRQATFIETSIGNTTRALLEGALMVALVVIVFLGSLRANVITLCVLPLSLLVSVLVLRALGGGINTMTLGGMAIAIGSLVDDAIIDVENVVRRLRENAARPADQRRSASSIVYDASVEVRPSIVLATLIILLVFTPLFVLSGVEGRLLEPLGVAFTVSLAASLLTALTLTPVMCVMLLPGSRTVRDSAEPRLVRGLKAVYTPVLDAALAHPWLLTAAAGLMFVVSVWGALGLGRSFLPEFNEGALVIGVVTLPGTSLEESDRLAHMVEETLMAHPEVKAMSRRTGRAEEDEHVQGVEASEIELTLDMDVPERLGLEGRDKGELLEAMRKDLALIPGVKATFGQPISHRIDHMLSGTRASVAVKIFGDDLGELRRLGAAVEERMATIRGVVDLSTEQQKLVPTLRVEFDRKAIARHGLVVGDVARALELSTRGIIAGRVLEGVNAYDMLLRVGEMPGATTATGSATRTDASAESMGETLVETPSGARVPLRVLAAVSEDLSPNFVSRENVQRKIVVMCNVAGRDVGSVVQAVRAGLAADVPLPTGYWIEYGGQFESAEATAQRLGWLGLAIVFGMAGLLYAVFRSMRDTALIMLNLPLALIGGVAGLAFTGGTLSVASIIGFITVFGVAARNGIMMVSHIRHLQRFEGVTDFREAVRRGALERLSPILMTALASGLALVPLALGSGKPGNEILGPMATVIIFGLLSATALNMALVPALFLKFGQPVGPDDSDKKNGSSGSSGGSTRRVVASACVLLLPVLVTGCATESLRPDYEGARALITATTGASDIYDPDAEPLSAQEITSILDGGLTLDESLRLALLNSRRLQAGFMGLGIARADYVQAGLLQNPSLGFAFLFPAGGGHTRVVADLAQNVMEIWRLPERQAVAAAGMEQRVLELARQAGELVAQTKVAYYESVAAREAHAVAHERTAVAYRALDAIRERVKHGTSTAIDANLAFSIALSADLEERRAERRLAVEIRHLASLFSLTSDLADVPLTDPLPEPAASLTDREALVEFGCAARLDLRALAAAVVVAEARVALESKRAVPDVDLGVSYERPETSFPANHLVGPSLSLELPIFDQNQAQISKAEFELRQLRMAYEALEAEVRQQVRATADQARLSADMATFVNDQLLPQAERSAQLAREAHEQGSTTLLPVLEVEGSALEARGVGVDAALEAVLALVELERVLGGVLPEDVLAE